ncbi:MAG TPA: SDR family oxidoreductase [Actinophytocola sp.]|uniref:SDR family NAD(P)-dependent oxidoreductase n=1 Tax=Actinophytocola sp. TaxID=1872138 RepID=UPI002DDDAF23|nr:SDR family oxidoreductase [Actinophytocola sp.]HEV2783848.1 SDR family oxidoreductase [Actinophytocola sp.]
MSRSVLVTGASRGIGRAIATAFATAGDRVAVHYSAGRADAEDTLAGLPGTGHHLVAGDLADPDAAERIVRTVVDTAGGVDVLINNAAVATSVETYHPVAKTSYVDWVRIWRQAIDVNLLGAANVSYWAARHMIDHGRGGRIVNVGSRGAYRGEPANPAYGASKAGLHALGQSLAVSLAPYGIAVTSVAPGFVRTDRQRGTLGGPEGDRVRAQSPFNRVGEPEEVAAAVLYLASADAQWASGAVLDLNGASHLR